jgi:hypothetical protein
MVAASHRQYHPSEHSRVVVAAAPRILSSWAIALEAMDAAATATKTEDRIVLCCIVDVFNECAVYAQTCQRSER